MSRTALLWLALAALVAAPGVVRSGADFTASSASPANVLATAADFNTVAVAMADPGGPLAGSVELESTPTSDRGIERVRYEAAPAGSNGWTTACQATVAPFTCEWDTNPDAGSRDLRAVAIDLAGYTRTSAVIASRMVDNTPPTAALENPGAWLEGTESLSASATDAHSGLATLAIDVRPAGGAWSELCAGSVSPRPCSLVTTALADGAYELRARATDQAGNERIGTTVARAVDNLAPTVSIPPPAGPLRGTVNFPIAAADTGTGIGSVTLQFRPSGGGPWTTVCVDQVASYACQSIDTTGVPDDLYEARAIALDDADHSTTSATLTNVRVDNTAPSTPTLTDPGTPLGGSVALAGTAADAGSGVASWTVEYRVADSSDAWTAACADTTAPWAGCTWATTAVADALYDLRAVTRDVAGNTRTSAERQDHRIDNNGPTLAFAGPGSPLRGNVDLTATAIDPAGMQSVVFERSPAGAGTWTTICTDNATPYTCAWNTALLADGSYDLRARATDTLTHTSTVVVAARQVDNTAPAGAAVETGNGAGGAGQLAAGDWIRFSWTEPVAPASVLAGWDGSAVAVRLELENKNGKDEMDFWNGTGATRLNLVDTRADLKLNANYVATAGWFHGTMTRSGSTITVTFGAWISGTLTTAGPGTIDWKPSAQLKDLAGNPGSIVKVLETGGPDVDF